MAENNEQQITLKITWKNDGEVVWFTAKENIKWIEEEDSNTKYFHAIINERRRRRASIQRIQRFDGQCINGDEDIAREVVEYFSAMFKDEGEPELQHLECIDQKVTHEDNIRLCVIPDEEESRKPVFYQNSNSSPGPDGFGGSFYQRCWDIIKPELIEFIQQFFGGAELSRFFTSSCLILLPKVENPSSFNDMRPISLSNYSNKIISKIMSSRLNSILPKIIFDNQTGFLNGRSITENILLAQEIIHGICKKNFGGNVVIKLDMAKAYDRVNWKFLLNALRKFGFSENWIDLVWRSISNVWGFSMVQSGPQVTHLAYADDVVIFSSGGKRALKLVMHQLQNYEKCFGQLINTGKSYFLVDPKASNITIQRIKEGKLLSVGGRATLIKHILQSQPIYLLSVVEPPKPVFKQLETYMARFFWGSDEDISGVQVIRDVITDDKWDVDQLQLPEFLTEQIRSIGIGDQSCYDIPVWMPNSTGNFTTSSVLLLIPKIDYVIVKWHKPPEYWLKINIDGSKDAEGNSGIGGICRDHRGKLTMTIAFSIGRTSSNMVEASAALAGVEWCSRSDCNNIILECDSQLVVDLINGKSKLPWQMQGIIKRIQDIAGQLNCAIRHCYRESNQIADALAK
uniref:RNase H type-1 domain-containing protein n=1 Tax=Nicotiana tabacum TaxID=4097 RepID=A0A1S4ACK5_TOBAC|nr:PREDICTED: uncharacterized protein LOC107796124 [Nicotiana tabacum]